LRRTASNFYEIVITLISSKLCLGKARARTRA